MKIEKIEIENFRGFKGKHEVMFQPDVNVFVGVNGAGKSSVLDLLGKVMGAVIHEITTNYYSPMILDTSDISFEKTKTSIKADFLNSSSKPFFITLDFDTQTNNLLLKNLLNGNEGVSLHPVLTNFSLSEAADYPIFRYFHSKRTLQNTEELVNLKYLSPQMATYEGCFHSLNSFEKFAKWFKEQEDDENRIKIRTKNINYEAPKLGMVRQAINTFLSHFKDLQMDNIRVDDSKTIYNDINDLCLDKNGVTHNLNQLSSGEQTIILIVADIAHHLSIANPDSSHKTIGKGIVLIDEIDIHLHPSWQRDIIPALIKTFPNIQFFITTHSPQVLSNIKNDKIIAIENFEFITDVPETFGFDSNSILRDVFETETEPKHAQEAFQNLYKLINLKQTDNAKILLEKLETEYSNQHPDWKRAKTHLDFVVSKVS